MAMTPLRLFLDTNVVSNLVNREYGDPAPRREQLLQAVKAGLVRVSGSTEVLGELAGMIRGTNKSLFPQVRDMYFQIVDEWWIRPFTERWRAEACVPGRLPDDDLYLHKNRWQKLIELSQQKLWVAVASRVKQHKQKYKADFEDARTSVVARWKEEARRNGIKDTRRSRLREAALGSYRERDVDAWCRRTLKDAVSRRIIPPSVDGWKDPKAVTPSLWHNTEYHLAMMASEVGDQSRIKGSDSYDARHYAAAAVYSDLLVTEDGVFSKTCMRITERAVEVIGLPEFDQRVHALLEGAGRTG